MAVVQLCSCVDSGLFPVFTSAASDKKTGELVIASTHTFTHHHTTILSQLQAPPAKRRKILPKRPIIYIKKLRLPQRRSKRLNGQL